jgi:hypothetical protein
MRLPFGEIRFRPIWPLDKALAPTRDTSLEPHPQRGALLSEERDGRERLPSIADRGPGQSVSESSGYDKPVKRRRQPKALR